MASKKIDRMLRVAELSVAGGWGMEADVIATHYQDLVDAAGSVKDDGDEVDPAVVRKAVVRYFKAIQTYGEEYDKWYLEFAKAYNASVKKTTGDKRADAYPDVYDKLPPLWGAEAELLAASIDYMIHTGKSPTLPQEIGKFR